MARVPSQHPSPDQTLTRGSGLRRAVHRLLAIAVVACVGLLPGNQVYAAPSVEEIEAQIDKQWEELEPVIEQYNQVRSQLKVNRKKSEELQKRIQPLSLQAALALNRVGDLASRYYKTGPSSHLNALLLTGDPGSLAEQLTMLNRLAEQEQEQVAGVVAIRDRFNAEKNKLDTLIAQQVKQEAELAAKKKQIDEEIKRLKKMMPKTVVSVDGCPTVTGVVSSAARTAIATACAQVGDPYVWGATGPDAFDCSGLTQFAYARAGIHLTHFTGAQWSETTAVSRSEARPGDLVFFFSDRHHVGLYLGNDLMVHAPRAGKPVQVANINYMPVVGFRRPY